ncbi:hypothetical protein C8F04DRAFT_1193828 [Mycena alexandri]|uniref:Uncharacterized protein n=1 Tax=Mycena alexandri TaxID=1745969 RepID=A0AAD6S9B4_9AGAR|nr:hypothetical protein C8F04DRAFT_1193828 [Mycena alexandri]
MLNLRHLGDGFNLEFTLVLVASSLMRSDSEVVKLTGSNIVLGLRSISLALRVCVRASDTMQLNLVQRSFFWYLASTSTLLKSSLTCLAMAVASTGFPPRNSTQFSSNVKREPIPGELDLREIQQRCLRVHLSQMSTPRLKPIKQPAQVSLRRTNASSAPASLNEASLVGSPSLPSSHQVLNVDHTSNSSGERAFIQSYLRTSGRDAAGCEFAAPHAARVRRRRRILGPRNSCWPRPSTQTARDTRASLGQKVCGDARGGGGGWEEKRKDMVRVRVRAHLPYASRTCGAARGDSTRMRSCVPAEREFAQTATGAVSHRLDSAHGGAMGWLEGRRGDSARTQVHPAEYGQTEPSAVCTRLDGAGVRRWGRQDKGRRGRGV